MHHKKKAFILMLVAILAVVVVGSVGVTYAWFLSKYTSQYTVVLDSDSFVVLKYEGDLAFASGDISSAANKLRPAEAKQTIGIEQDDLAPFDMFDTTKVDTSANTVKYTARGAYWTGKLATVGQFTPSLHAYLADFLEGEDLADHLETFSEETSVTEYNFLDVLAEEAEEKSVSARLLAREDLVQRGEIGYFMIFDYLGQKFLYYNGAFYIRGNAAGADLTLPSVAVDANAELLYWHALTAESRVTYGGTEYAVSDGTYLLLQPNTTFRYTLYVFVARTDEERDPEIDGKRVTFFASITVQ